MIEAVDIVKTFAPRGGPLFGTEPVKALRGVSITIPNAGAVALIGESGCGKTTLGRVLCGLEPYDSGEILFDGMALSTLGRRDREARFRGVQLVHQDPYAALNPVRTIGAMLTDALNLRAKTTRRDRTWVRQRMRELLSLVGLDPEEILYKYPHNLSGGQRQRVVVARTLCVDPTVLVADEAVSMIDVSLRLGILSLLDSLRRRLEIGILFITHDVAAARYVARDGTMVVIYRGEVFESGPVDEIIQEPVNPYTQSLLSAVPVLVGLERPGRDRFIPREDMEVDSAEGACLFSRRCPFATNQCQTHHPDLLPIASSQHKNRCFYPQVRRVVAVRNDAAGQQVMA